MNNTLTKKKVAVPLIITTFIFIWVLVFDIRASALNEILANDAEISRYPYSFRVVGVNDGVATMYSLRSAEASAIRSLRFMFPALVYENDDSQTMAEAQKQLARIQSKAARIVKDQPDIQEIKWKLDKRWLEGHGVMFL